MINDKEEVLKKSVVSNKYENEEPSDDEFQGFIELFERDGLDYHDQHYEDDNDDDPDYNPF